MRRERDDSEDDDVPLHHKRPFGAGLKRKRVEFVKATEPDAGAAAVSGEANKGALVGDLYASIVLGSRPTDASASEASGGVATEPTSAAKTKKEPELPVCPVCSLPITTTTLRQHEASLAHQASLAHSHPPSALDRTRMGLRALESQGWDPDSRQGLGRDGDGVRFPIKATLKEDTLGVGATWPAKQEAKPKPRPLTAKEMRAQAEKERKRGERLQAEIFGRVDVERYLRGNGSEDGA